jgi:hypothetical protein
MFFNKVALAAWIAFTSVAASIMAPSAACADEKHLTLDDIDGLARQHLVDSMRKTEGANQPQPSGLSTPLPGAAAPAPPIAAVTPPLVVMKPKREAPPVKQVPAVSFIGAYADTSGTHHVLYDYQGGIYPARAGETLMNGWTVSRVDGFNVTVSYGKRTWNEVISAPAAPVAVADSGPVQAITDLGGPLPPGGIIPLSTATNSAPGGRATFIPLGK